MTDHYCYNKCNDHQSIAPLEEDMYMEKNTKFCGSFEEKTERSEQIKTNTIKK